MNTIVAQGISFMSMNYLFQDKNEEFSMKTNYIESEQTLFEQVLQFFGYIDTNQYDNIYLIGNSIGGVLLSKIIPKLPFTPKHLIILWYITWFINLNSINCPTTIVQGQFDKYWWIELVQKDIQSKNIGIKYHEIKNAEHAYYDHQDPSIRYLDQVIQIILHTIQS